MILYQYVSADVGKKILTDRRVGLRRQEYFNDPLEGAISPVQPSSTPESLISRIKGMTGFNRLDSNGLEALPAVQTLMSAERVGKNCVVLCLTKNPLNPLMWAYYSGLDGMVIGFDVGSEFFTGLNNACPIQFGDVIYVSDRPEPVLESQTTDPKDDWFMHPFDESNMERVKGAFLYKAEDWFHEKEVRLVKRLNDDSENAIRHERTCDRGRELYLYDIPESTIAEVYVFARPLELHNYKAWWDVGHTLRLFELKKWIVDELGIKLCAAKMSEDRWGLEGEDISQPGPPQMVNV